MAECRWMIAMLFAVWTSCAVAQAEPSIAQPRSVASASKSPEASLSDERDPRAMDPAPANPQLRPVFEQFGGEPGLAALVDVFIDKLVADPRTHRLFVDVERARLKTHLVEQFCVILGGGCVYSGRDMRTAHKGLNIDRAKFNALVEDLQISMSARGIPFRAQNKLLARLAPFYRDVEHR